MRRIRLLDDGAMKIEVKDEFYMVWRETTGEVHFRHPYYGAAREEAKRLAKKCPKEKLFVLKAISMYAHIDMDTKISVRELIELPDAVIAQLSKGMQKKILAVRQQIKDWEEKCKHEWVNLDTGPGKICHKCGQEAGDA
jgi:hypothetical protein